MSESRLNYHALAPKAASALTRFTLVAGSTLSHRLKEMVHLRISQINGCAVCIDMHWSDLVRQGMDPRHINAIAGWREAHRFFDAAERAALQWAESVNALPHRTPTDTEFNALRQHFSDQEVADLTFAVCAIRAWNALNASFQSPVPETPHPVAT